MKNILALSALALALVSCGGNMQQEDNNELKVLSWNIWHGGHSKEYPGKGCEGTLGMLKESKADVVLMIETYGASHQVADHLGYYHRLLSSNLSIYSRYPIVETYTFPDSISTFNFGGVMINKNGKKIRLFDTWLHYLPDTRKVPTDKSEAEILAWDDAGTRDDEIRRILNVMKPFMAESDSIPVIMTGDFNSHSHLDWTEATKNMYNHNGAVVNWTVSVAMQKAGFKDSFREINPDPVKNLGVTWLWTGWKKDREDRIDYIYYHGNAIKPIASEAHDGDLGKDYMYNGKPFFYASDHGFVTTTFKLLK